MEAAAEPQSKQIGYRVTPTFYKRAQAAAKADRRKLMEYARLALVAAVERFESENLPASPAPPAA